MRIVGVKTSRIKRSRRNLRRLHQFVSEPLTYWGFTTLKENILQSQVMNCFKADKSPKQLLEGIKDK